MITSEQKANAETIVPIFLERFVLPILAALIGIIVINTIKLDLQQRVSLSLCIVCLAYFVSHSIQKNKASDEPATVQPATVQPPIVQPVAPTGDAVTNGDQSVANTGSGNTIVVNPSPTKTPLPKTRKRHP